MNTARQMHVAIVISRFSYPKKLSNFIFIYFNKYINDYMCVSNLNIVVNFNINNLFIKEEKCYNDVKGRKHSLVRK